MHVRILFGVFAIGVLTILMSPVGYGQFGGGGGGFPGGGKGGFGGKGGGRMSQDPNQRFDGLALGRPFFLISESTPGMQNMLTTYQQEKGVNFPNGQVSREQYLEFSEYLKAKFAGGGFFWQQGRPQGEPWRPTRPRWCPRYGSAPHPGIDAAARRHRLQEP